MNSFFAALAVVLFIGAPIATMIEAYRGACDGYEDSLGFHYGPLPHTHQ